MVLEDFFPGIRDELVRRGAVAGDGMARSRWHIGGDWHVQFESGLFGVCQSRPLLEQVVRERLAKVEREATILRSLLRISCRAAEEEIEHRRAYPAAGTRKPEAREVATC